MTIVRVASIRTKLVGNLNYAEYERPIAKLCLSPISDNDEPTEGVILPISIIEAKEIKLNSKVFKDILN